MYAILQYLDIQSKHGIQYSITKSIFERYIAQPYLEVHVYLHASSM